MIKKHATNQHIIDTNSNVRHKFSSIIMQYDKSSYFHIDPRRELMNISLLLDDKLNNEVKKSNSLMSRKNELLKELKKAYSHNRELITQIDSMTNQMNIITEHNKTIKNEREEDIQVSYELYELQEKELEEKTQIINKIADILNKKRSYTEMINVAN
jgi:uncharacterized protein YcfL